MNIRIFIVIVILFCAAQSVTAQTTSQATQVVTFSVRITHQPLIASASQITAPAASQYPVSETVFTVPSGSIDQKVTVSPVNSTVIFTVSE